MVDLIAPLYQESFSASDGPGLMDPCEKEVTDALDNVVPQDREKITANAQVMAAPVQTEPK